MNTEPPKTRYQREHQPRRPGYGNRSVNDIMFVLLTLFASAAVFNLVLGLSVLETTIAVALCAALSFVPSRVEQTILRITGLRPIPESKHYSRQESCYTVLLIVGLICFLPDLDRLGFIVALVVSILAGKAIAQLANGESVPRKRT